MTHNDTNCVITAIVAAETAQQMRQAVESLMSTMGHKDSSELHQSLFMGMLITAMMDATCILADQFVADGIDRFIEDIMKDSK